MDKVDNFTTESTQVFHLRNESGAAMLLSIMLMVVLSLLTITLFELLTASTQIIGNHRLEIRTLYIADAGVEAAINELRDNPDWVDGIDPAVPFADGTYEVLVASNTEGSNPAIWREAVIIATGTVSDFTRTIEVHVKIIRIGATENFTVATTEWKLI